MKTPLSSADLRRIAKLIAKTEVIKARIAKNRDDLRETLSDIEAILANAEEAHDDIAVGLQYLNSGVDTLSQYL